MRLENKNITIFFLIFSPLIFIFGSFITNLFIILFFLSIFYFKNYRIKFNLHEIILLIFLVYIFAQTLYLKNFEALPRILFISVFSYIFFSSKYLRLNYYNENNFNLIFYIFFAIINLFFLYFIFFQFDLNSIQRFSAFFGDEKILGSYLSKFYLLIINFYFILKNKNLSNKILFIYILLCLVFVTFSVERMALIMFIFNLVAYFFIKKKYAYTFFILTAIFTIIFSIYSFVPETRNHFVRFIADTGIFKNLSYNHSTSALRNQVYLDLPERYINQFKKDEFPKKLNVTKKRLDDRKNNINQDQIIYFFDNFHGSVILNSFTLLKNNYIFGIGIKNFRKLCESKILTLNNVDYILHCSTHPHNIYVEILLETGVLGLILFLLFLIIFLYNIFIKFDYRSNLHCTLVSLLLILTFPLQSTGSFFSSRYLFFYFITFIFINSFIINNKK